MPRNEPKSAVEIKLEKIERGIELMDVRVTTMDQRLERIGAMLEANTQQVATFCEGLTRLENLVTDGFRELKAVSQQQADTTAEQLKLANKQADTVDRLAKLLEQQHRG